MTIIAQIKNISYCAKKTSHQYIEVENRATKDFIEEIDKLVSLRTDIETGKLLLDYIETNLGKPQCSETVNRIHEMMREEQAGGTPIVLLHDNIYEFYIEMPGTGPCAPLGQTIVKRIVEILDNTDTTWFISDSTLTVVFE